MNPIDRNEVRHCSCLPEYWLAALGIPQNANSIRNNDGKAIELLKDQRIP